MHPLLPLGVIMYFNIAFFCYLMFQLIGGFSFFTSNMYKRMKYNLSGWKQKVAFYVGLTIIFPIPCIMAGVILMPLATVLALICTLFETLIELFYNQVKKL